MVVQHRVGRRQGPAAPSRRRSAPPFTVGIEEELQIVDPITGALASGMRDVTFNLDSNDFIRITGYLVRKSDLKKLEETGIARHGSDVLAAGSVAHSHVDQRAVKRVISHESAPRAAG